MDYRFPQPDPRAYDVLLVPVAYLPDPSPWLYPVYCGPGAEYRPQPAPVAGPHCGGCGYLRGHHGADDGCPGLKTKRFEERGPVEQVDWQEVLRRDVARRLAPPEPYIAPVVLPPRIPARAPRNVSEIAAGQGRQAVGLGRKAIAAGWLVEASYALAGDGTEMSAVKLARGPLRGVAVWRRAPGMLGSKTGWASDVAYAWRTDVGRIPTKMTITDFEGLVMSA